MGGSIDGFVFTTASIRRPPADSCRTTCARDFTKARRLEGFAFSV
ncbi:MAG: hypothetical protein ABGY32_11835 [bacterium]